MHALVWDGRELRLDTAYATPQAGAEVHPEADDYYFEPTFLSRYARRLVRWRRRASPGFPEHYQMTQSTCRALRHYHAAF